MTVPVVWCFPAPLAPARLVVGQARAIVGDDDEEVAVILAALMLTPWCHEVRIACDDS